MRILHIYIYLLFVMDGYSVKTILFDALLYTEIHITGKMINLCKGYCLAFLDSK